MFIIDFQQIVISNFMVHLTSRTINKEEIDEDLIRHMILNSLRSIHNKFKKDYGDMVIAYDSGSWRKDVFPYYKAGRRKSRDKSIIDWGKLFTHLNQLKEELKEALPYKIIAVSRCEADDIIGCLVRLIGSHEKVMIVSGDRDFIQLHNKNVQQYDPVQKKRVKDRLSPADFLYEHILRGCTGDGVPNVLSDDDTFVTEGKRQKPLTKKKIDMISNIFEDHDEAIEKNIKRNEQLIDLTKTPEELIIKITEQYANYPPRDKKGLYQYLMFNNCQQLLESIGDF